MTTRRQPLPARAPSPARRGAITLALAGALWAVILAVASRWPAETSWQASATTVIRAGLMLAVALMAARLLSGRD